MKTIHQGRPITKYFRLAVPFGSGVVIGDDVCCKHPRTGKETFGVCTDTFLFQTWAEVPEWYCLESYGCPTSEAKAILEGQFPEFAKHPGVKFLQIKQN